MLTVTLTGDAELGARLDGLPAAVLAAVAAKSAALADQLLDLVGQKLSGGVLQSRTGALAASVGVDGPTITETGVVTTLFAGADLKYAAIQEYGGVTAPHDILPVRAKALAFLVGGEQGFAKIVHHPGSRIPERSYLRSSLAEMAETIGTEMKDAMAQAASAFGTLTLAAGGYDVPAGINPITQLHAQEMVLPARLANPMRDMLSSYGGGGGAAGGGDTHLHYAPQVTEARGDFRQQLQGHASDLMAMIQSAVRSGSLKLAAG